MRVAIVGAGVTGLTAGYQLARRGHFVRVFERESQIGGLVQTIRVGRTALEKTYHHLFTSDDDFVALLAELGLTDRLRWLTPKNALYINRRLYPFTSAKDLLLLRALSLRNRLALGRLVFTARRIDAWQSLDGLSARQWVIGAAGEGVWEHFWRPLMAAKFDRDADEVSAVWLWNKIKLRGSSRGRNPNRETLGYVEGSFGLVVDALAERIARLGGTVETGVEVRQIRVHPDRTPEIHTARDESAQRFDAVLVTSAPRMLLEMTPDLPATARDRLSRIRYKANRCLLLELTEPLSAYYWTSVVRSDWPFVAVIEHTNLLPRENYGSHVVYLSRYLDETDELYRADDATVREVFVDHLHALFPEFDRSRIINARGFRSRFAQPVIVSGYGDLIGDLRLPAPMDRVYLASMAQIFPEDRGQNYAVRLGRRAAELIDAPQ